MSEITLSLNPSLAAAVSSNILISEAREPQEMTSNKDLVFAEQCKEIVMSRRDFNSFPKVMATFNKSLTTMTSSVTADLVTLLDLYDQNDVGMTDLVSSPKKHICTGWEDKAKLFAREKSE